MTANDGRSRIFAALNRAFSGSSAIAEVPTEAVEAAEAAIAVIHAVEPQPDGDLLELVEVQTDETRNGYPKVIYSLGATKRSDGGTMIMVVPAEGVDPDQAILALAGRLSELDAQAAA